MIIGRLLAPTTGRVDVGRLDVATAKSVELARHLAILRQDNHITARLRVRELVSMGRFPHSGGRLRPADIEAVDQAMGFLDLTDLADRFIDQMSGGQRQRAFIAMVLAQDAEYILLDEPLNNLDMQHSVQMMRRLRSAADELGRTVVLVMHDLDRTGASRTAGRRQARSGDRHTAPSRASPFLPSCVPSSSAPPVSGSTCSPLECSPVDSPSEPSCTHLPDHRSRPNSAMPATVPFLTGRSGSTRYKTGFPPSPALQRVASVLTRTAAKPSFRHMPPRTDRVPLQAPARLPSMTSRWLAVQTQTVSVRLS